MRKIVICFSLILSFIFNAGAQSTAIDRNKLMDFFQNQQFDEAISYLAPAAASDSSNLQLLSWLGYAYYMNDNSTVAGSYYRRMFSIDSNSITANYYLSRIIGNTDPETAASFAIRLVQLQPGNPVHYRAMAGLLLREKQRDSALRYYNRAYELAPNDTKNAAGLAELLIDKKDFARADSILEAGLGRDSLNIPCLKLRIRSAYETKNYIRVPALGERLVRMDEPALNALTQLSLAYYNLKKYNDCIRICEYMLSKDLLLESVYYYEAKAWAQLKEYGKSNELLRLCLSKAIAKTAETYYYELGENAEATNQYKAAIAQYDTAYYLFKSPLMKYNGGRIYELRLKNAVQARKYFLQYLAVAKPESAEEKKAWEYVKSQWGKKKATGMATTKK